MSNLNDCNFIGRLGNECDTAFTPNGLQVTKFSIAVSEKWKDKNTGQQQERTEWIRITAFGKLAEICSTYLSKGSLVFIKGKMTTDKYKDKDGKDCYSTYIKAGEMKILSSKNDTQQSQGQQGFTTVDERATTMNGGDDVDSFSDDGEIPF